MSSDLEVPAQASAPESKSQRTASSARLLWVLPVAAVVLTGMTAWKLSQPPQTPAPEIPDASAVRVAPLFELRDPDGGVVRLATFSGRHKLLIVFFQASKSFEDSPVLTELTRGFGTIHEQQPRIFAIGTQQAGIYRRWREASDSVPPCTVLSDLLEPYVYQRWGAVDPKSRKPVEAVFIVDSAGLIRRSHLGPDALGTAEEWAKELAAVR